MPINVADLTATELNNLIENHERKGATASSLYEDALRELASRMGRGLDLERSLAVISQAASDGRFLSYKELADASGADWSTVRHQIGGHLGTLIKFGHRKGWPMLSAIVVNQPNLSNGDMDPPTLKGFVSAAHAVGYEIVDENAFLREQQEAVFAWAKAAARKPPVGV